jgi:rifampin ADP-ribosylating transferase
MEFNPNNNIIKRCLQGMDLEGKNQPEKASSLFLQAWNEATNDSERFIAAHYVMRHQEGVVNKLKWVETSVQLALKINNDYVNEILPSLYLNTAKYYEALGDLDNAKKNYELAISFEGKQSNTGPFYHGTKADMQIGDLLVAGFMSNYQPEVTMNHIYFTALVNGAGLAAELVKGDGRERVYIVEPTGSFESDPNVTDKKFPGNPTRSYRTQAPLKIIGEVLNWTRQTPEAIQKWRERLENIKNAEIIN